MGEFVNNTTSAVVCLFFMVEGGAMHDQHYVLQKIYVGNSQTEIETLICQENKIADGDLARWLPQNFARVRFYNPAEGK